MTTIKVPTDLRDRINAFARQRGVSAAGLIEDLLDERERVARMQQFQRAFSSAGDDYWDEFSVWSSAEDDDGR